jgi:hypothetical protein
MKNLCILLGIVFGLTTAGGVSAQTVATNSTSGASSIPLKAPHSNRLTLSAIAGKVRVLNSKGLILETNYAYTAAIQISDLSDQELHALLETKTAYTALTAFGPVNERTTQSVAIENQLRQIWLQGKSLADKIQTRLELLDAMRNYNTTLAYLPGYVDVANQNAYVAGIADNRLAWRMANDSQWKYRGAQRIASAEDTAYVADYQSAAANQQVSNYLNQCAAISAQVAAYGINIPASPQDSPSSTIGITRVRPV